MVAKKVKKTVRKKVVIAVAKKATAVVVAREVKTGVNNYLANGTVSNGPVAVVTRDFTKSAVQTIPGPWNCTKPCKWNGKQKKCLAEDGTQC